MEEERDGGDVKGEESVTNPIPIVGGKMKKRGVEYKCESCNKVGWFDSLFFFLSFFLPFLVELLGAQQLTKLVVLYAGVRNDEGFHFTS